MRNERRQSIKGLLRIEVKRSTELWLYSFADMYMIISVLFIATTALYAKKVKDLENAKVSDKASVATVQTALRGPAAAAVTIALEFEPGSAELTTDSVEKLTTILPLISDLKSSVVDIEAYSDAADRDVDSEYETNLDLSAERAVRVADWFLGKGLSESRVRTTAFGRDHKFTDGDKGEATGRRAVVKFYSTGPSS